MMREAATFITPDGLLEMNLDATQLTCVIAQLEDFVSSPDCDIEVWVDLCGLLFKLRRAQAELLDASVVN